MPMKYIAPLLIATTMFCAACETSKADRAHPQHNQTASKPSSLNQAESTRLTNRAEHLRDRSFEQRPKLEAVTSSDELPAAPKLSQEVADERTLLIERLFGPGPTTFADDQTHDDQTQQVAAPAFSELAGYDKQNHRVLYVQGDATSDESEAAIIAALVQALDANYFEALPTPSSWDQRLALEAGRSATVAFALARHLLDVHHPDTNPALLATRPELTRHLPVLADWLTADRLASKNAHTWTDKIKAREQAFVLREGWTLAAALYRSSGWSGVELSRLMPPQRSVDVVRPDQWMSGEPVGTWSWPTAEDHPRQHNPAKARAGKVGPAITTMWLEDVIDPRLARTVYAGYMSDAYRFFAPHNESPARFEWLSAWNSPDAAQQIAAAFEKRLRLRFDKATTPAEHYVVFQKGLKVGVIIAATSQDNKRERAQALLNGHKLSLETRDGLPTNFVPTRQDRLLEATQAATLNERQWVDPATKLQLDLSTLGDQWRVQQPDRGPVRWFASHASGSLLQLTAELDDPFGPTFSSDAYRERLVEAFTSSLDQAKLEHVAPTDVTPSRGLMVRVRGQVDGNSRTLQIWQFERGDLIVSYSLQAPPEVFETHKKLAKSMLNGVSSLEASEPAEREHSDSPDAAPSTGSIEYEVED
jgi:hypothetical protein